MKFDPHYGVIFLPIAISCFAAYKQVMTKEIFGLANLPSFIVFDQMATGIGVLIIPSFLTWMSSYFEDVKVIFKFGAAVALIWYFKRGKCVLSPIFEKKCRNFICELGLMLRLGDSFATGVWG